MSLPTQANVRDVLIIFLFLHPWEEQAEAAEQGGVSEATDRSVDGGGGSQQQQQQVGDLTPHHAFPPLRPGTDRIHRLQIVVNSRQLKPPGYRNIFIYMCGCGITPLDEHLAQ